MIADLINLFRDASAADHMAALQSSMVVLVIGGLALLCRWLYQPEEAD